MEQAFAQEEGIFCQSQSEQDNEREMAGIGPAAHRFTLRFGLDLNSGEYLYYREVFSRSKLPGG
jgi:hypothetical protein